MKDFFKKQWIAFYASIVAVIMALVSMILYGVNASNDYYIGRGSFVDALVFVFTILAILLIAARVVLSELMDGNKIVKYACDGAILVACVFIASAFMCFVSQRVYDIGIVLGSDLEAGNDAAYSAVMQSIAGFVLYGITLLIAVVSAFFGVTRKTETVEENAIAA